MNKICLQYFKTPLGELILGDFHERLCLCDWRYGKRRPAIDKRLREGLGASFEDAETVVTEKAKRQLEEYFLAGRIDFDVPLLMVGTSFQKRVWGELLKIPYGRTESYLGFSGRIGNGNAIRSAAAAIAANAISIFNPCHRIIGSNGRLTGYGGGLHAKRELLLLEMYQQAPYRLQLFA